MNKTDLTLGRAIRIVTMEHARSTTKRAWLHTLGCAALATAIMAQPSTSSAATETVDGVEWNYNVTNGETTIDRASKTSMTGGIVIPSMLGGYPVKSIGDYAFSSCDGLTSVTIPNSVTSIGKGAFDRRSKLQSVTIPNSVTNIGEGAFFWCPELTSISVDSNNPVYDSRNGCNAIIETASGKLIAGCKNTVIPVGVTTIEYGAFYLCSELQSVTIPESVTSIGKEAFFHCDGLTSITIPASVTSIGAYAFSNCDGMQAFTIPASVKSIGEEAFSCCYKLMSISVDSNNPVYDSRNGCNAIIKSASGELIAGCKNTVIPAGVTSIGEDAFAGCSGLTTVTVPESVTSIGRRAFAGSGLTSITIPESVTSIGDNAFHWCSKLQSVTIPKSVTSIGKEAFSSCSELTSITIPAGVTSIGEGTFYWCHGLTSVTIPESVKSIGASAFNCCRELTSVTIPNSVTSIGYQAFWGCSKLETVFLPKGYSGNTDVFPKGVKIVRREAESKDAKSETKEKAAKEVKKLALEMVPIPGKNYAICKYEVTQALWEAIMGKSPSKFKGVDRPVENVSWTACQKFLEKLNALPEVKTSGRTYRLPTADEWRYACRAGSKGDFCRLADGTDVTPATLGQVAWCLENSGEETHPVGQKEPNAFGLYDMHGNVLEWTSSATDIGCRIECGGCWDFSAFYGLKVSDQFADPPDHYANDVGFRLACFTKGEPEEKDFTPEFVAQCKVKAEAGDPEGQALYGRALSNGWGVEKDLTKAAEWYRKAAEWYAKAAKQGNASAPSNVGVDVNDE